MGGCGSAEATPATAGRVRRHPLTLKKLSHTFAENCSTANGRHRMYPPTAARLSSGYTVSRKTKCGNSPRPASRSNSGLLIISGSTSPSGLTSISAWGRDKSAAQAQRTHRAQCTLLRARCMRSKAAP
eukprot:363622-Chlamydomonas_euryale.AAC.7